MPAARHGGRNLDGTELTGSGVLAWSDAAGAEPHDLVPGKPTQNGCVESFNRCMRAELLDETLFFMVRQTRAIRAHRVEIIRRPLALLLLRSCAARSISSRRG